MLEGEETNTEENTLEDENNDSDKISTTEENVSQAEEVTEN